MTIIPFALINCSVVELLLQVFALVYGSYGEQHCITSPKFLSIRNNVIPPQLLQMTTKVMLAPNLNLSMLLSQHADTMTLYMSSMTEMSWYLEAIMSVTSVESTTYHCYLSSPSTEAILQVSR